MLPITTQSEHYSSIFNLEIMDISGKRKVHIWTTSEGKICGDFSYMENETSTLIQIRKINGLPSKIESWKTANHLKNLLLNQGRIRILFDEAEILYRLRGGAKGKGTDKGKGVASGSTNVKATDKGKSKGGDKKVVANRPGTDIVVVTPPKDPPLLSSWAIPAIDHCKRSFDANAIHISTQIERKLDRGKEAAIEVSDHVFIEFDRRFDRVRNELLDRVNNFSQEVDNKTDKGKEALKETIDDIYNKSLKILALFTASTAALILLQKKL